METSRDEVRSPPPAPARRRTALAAFGAAARGNTLLNCCGVTAAQITCVADPDPVKHGRFLPGSRIPIVPPTLLSDVRPDDLIILPWTNAAEITASLLPLRQRGTQFSAAVPSVRRV